MKRRMGLWLLRKSSSRGAVMVHTQSLDEFRREKD